MYGEAVFDLIFASKEKSAERVGPAAEKGHYKWERFLHHGEVTLSPCASAYFMWQIASALPVCIKF